MSKWLNAAKQFEEGCNSSDYFEVQSALGATEKIKLLLDGTFPQLLFLLGEPGSGKSFLMHHFKNIWANERDILLLETPFLTPLDLLKTLLLHKGIRCLSDDIEYYRVQATQLYKNTTHLIMIDEAQLLSPEMKEFIRILADSKAFWFLLAMHKSEGESILRTPHFKSRPHHTIMLKPISAMECKNYVQRELMRMDFSEIAEEMNLKLITHMHKLSHGNFRNFKKILYHFFHLLHYTNTHNRTKYLRPSSCMVTMAAMSAELLDD